MQNICNDELNTHTLALVLREFVWKELVDLKHRFDHSSALPEHPHDELRNRTEPGGKHKVECALTSSNQSAAALSCNQTGAL